MAQTYRFGRRVALPSTRQILHDLRAICAYDAAQADAPQAPAPAAAGGAYRAAETGRVVA